MTSFGVVKSVAIIRSLLMQNFDEYRDAMAVGGEQVAALRALLTKNFEEQTRLTRQLDDDGMHDYMTLVSAAFFEAVDRRFANADLPLPSQSSSGRPARETPRRPR